MAREASLEELLKSSFWSEMNKVYTAMPCIVINVHNNFEEQLVDVQPSLNILLQNGETRPRPPILSVPVIQPATNTSALTMPVNKGDTVLCVFSMRAIEIWQESDGKPTTPNNHAKFHDKDAFAIVGLFPRKNAINNPRKRTYTHSTADLVVAHNIGKSSEVEMRFKPDGKVIINSTTAVEVNCNEATINAESEITFNTPNATFTGNVQVDQTLTATTDVVGGGISLKDHLHDIPNIQSGGSTATSLPPS
jgi:hypothetical protein